MTLIYANRNRDLNRIKVSFDSLNNQSNLNFRVIFVDYGSNEPLVYGLKQLCDNYEFVTPYFLQVSQLLWNKSKALNFGISQTQSPYIFIADVDLIFHPETTQLLNKIAIDNTFYLFNLGYLDREESGELPKNYNFEDLRPARIGKVNGMILAPMKAILDVNGLDEFFHFYGSEDIDLFARLKHAGYKENFLNENLICHNWHSSFANAEDDKLTLRPRIKNIMRINQQHYKFNLENLVIKPLQQETMGVIIAEKDSNKLLKPSKQFTIPNILAEVEHFLNFELPNFSNEIVHVVFFEAPYFSSLKHKVKKILGKQTQPYCSLKEINDKLLKQIIYKFRDSNYSYKVADDLKSIIFCIEV